MLHRQIDLPLLATPRHKPNTVHCSMQLDSCCYCSRWCGICAYLLYLRPTCFASLRKERKPKQKILINCLGFVSFNLFYSISQRILATVLQLLAVAVWSRANEHTVNEKMIGVRLAFGLGAPSHSPWTLYSFYLQTNCIQFIRFFVFFPLHFIINLRTRFVRSLFRFVSTIYTIRFTSDPFVIISFDSRQL